MVDLTLVGVDEEGVLSGFETEKNYSRTKFRGGKSRNRVTTAPLVVGKKSISTDQTKIEKDVLL